MGAPLADPAVRGDLLLRRDPFALVELAELVGALEGAVVPYGRCPRDRGGRRNVARALRALLLVPGRRDQIAGELLRAADVDERLRLLADRLLDGVPVGADRLVALARAVLRVLGLRRLGRELAALVRPLLAAAVEQAH